MRSRRPVLVFSMLVLALLAVVAPVAQQQARLETPAERVKFSQGGTLYDPLMAFVRELERNGLTLQRFLASKEMDLQQLEEEYAEQARPRHSNAVRQPWKESICIHGRYGKRTGPISASA